MCVHVKVWLYGPCAGVSLVRISARLAKRASTSQKPFLAPPSKVFAWRRGWSLYRVTTNIISNNKLLDSVVGLHEGLLLLSCLRFQLKHQHPAPNTPLAQHEAAKTLTCEVSSTDHLGRAPAVCARNGTSETWGCCMQAYLRK